MKAKVIEIQVGGIWLEPNLEEATRRYCAMINRVDVPRTKINFLIELPDGSHKAITIRDDEDGTVAYGDFDGLPNALDYAREVAD